MNILSFTASADLSPIAVDRVDVDFSDRPWLFLSSVAIQDGSRTAASIEASQSAFVQTGDDTYRLRFSSFNVEVPEDRSKTISVRVVAKDDLRLAQPRELTVSIPAGSVRGRDEIGVAHYGPGEQQAAAFQKTFFVKSK